MNPTPQASWECVRSNIVDDMGSPIGSEKV